MASTSPRVATSANRSQVRRTSGIASWSGGGATTWAHRASAATLSSMGHSSRWRTLPSRTVEIACMRFANSPPSAVPRISRVM
jgi:hypothetical protein